MRKLHVSPRASLVLLSIFFALSWLPYLLSNLPGGVFTDTYWNWDQALGGTEFNTQQPILYTLYHKLVFAISMDMFGLKMFESVLVLTIIQYSLMAFTLAYTVRWLWQMGAPRLLVLFATLYFAFFPLVPFYAIANWKDTYFSLALLLFALKTFELLRWSVATRNIVAFFVFAFFVCFLRSNGPLVVLVTMGLLLFLRRKDLRFYKNSRIFAYVCAGILAFVFFVQGFLYEALGIKNANSAEEALGIPIQQVCYIVADEGKITEKQQKIIDSIIKPDIIEIYYSPNSVDKVKMAMDDTVLQEHKNEFIKTWLALIIQNPGKAVKAHLMETVGFWDVLRGGPLGAGYVQYGLWAGAENYDLKGRDLIYESTGFSFNAISQPKYYISAALFCFFALFCATLVLMRRKKGLLLGFVPLFALWLSVLATTPICYSLRYVYAFVLFVPVALWTLFAKDKSL